MKNQIKKQKPRDVWCTFVSGRSSISTLRPLNIIFQSCGLPGSCHFPDLIPLIFFFWRKISLLIISLSSFFFFIFGIRKNQSDKLMNALKLMMGLMVPILSVWSLSEGENLGLRVVPTPKQHRARCAFYHLGRSEIRQQTSYHQQGNLFKLVSQESWYWANCQQISKPVGKKDNLESRRFSGFLKNVHWGFLVFGISLILAFAVPGMF